MSVNPAPILTRPAVFSFVRAAALLSTMFASLVLVSVAVAQSFDLGRGQLAFESNLDGDWEIYLLDVATGIIRNLTDNTLDDHSPSWSPDGHILAFTSDRDFDMQGEIYRLTVGETRAQRVTTPMGNFWRPVWSPDGRLFALMLGFGRIGLIDASGGESRMIANGFGPVWSPDGRWVAYYADPDGRLNGDIYVVEVASNNRMNLTRHNANDWAPAWSPDGAWIAFASSRDGSSEIYRLAAHCLNQAAACADSIERLTFNTSNDSAPAWSHDGNQIAFVAEQGGRSDLRVVDVTGGEEAPLLVGMRSSQFPAWRP